MSRAPRSPHWPLALLLAATVAAACAPSETGVAQGRPDDPVISISEGPCRNTCPVYDMTLHPDGAYVLNGERYVKTVGVTEGNLGANAWAAAERALRESEFWNLKQVQTDATLENCQPEAPTVKITWRTKDGKEKTTTYNAGCGVQKMQMLVGDLRTAMKFDDLVWTDKKFDYKQPRL